MSAFLTLSQVSGGLPGTAPRLFTASTNGDYAAITTAGYMADLVAAGIVNVFDIIWINYDVDGTEAQGQFRVTGTSSGSLVLNNSDSDGGVALTSMGVKRGVTAAYGGGGTSNAFVATGLAATDIVVATIKASTNSVAVTKAVPTANTLTITFSADPGAGTTVQWHALPA